MAGARPGPFVCEVCGAPVPFGQIEAHKIAIHPEATALMEAANRFLGVQVLKIVVPSIIGVVAAIVAPSLVLGISAPGWYLVAAFIALFAVIYPAIRYGQRRTDARFGSVGDILRVCHVCDATTPRRDAREHLRAFHPAEARFLTRSFILAIGSWGVWGGIIVVVLSLGILDVILLPPLDILLLAFWAGTIAWMLGMAGYGILVWPRHVARARSEWQAERPQPSPSPPSPRE